MKDFLIRYQYVFQLVTLASGIFLMLVAFGVVKTSLKPEEEERWRREKGRTLKIASVVIVVSSLVGLATRMW
jgi:multisubunit Na+/H+ antiporter MnhB subunit